MASSNDRKISQLPVATSIEDTTNFIVVSGISTTPINQRISAETLFGGVPVSLVVGQEYDGRTVIFNATDDPTHRFVFAHETGNVTMGNQLSVANNVSVGGNLTVAGTTTFTNPIFTNLTVGGTSSFNGNTSFTELVDFSEAVTLAQNLTVAGITSISNNVTISGNTTISGTTSTQSLNSTNITASNVTASANVAAVNVNTTNINASGAGNFSTVDASSYIRAIGNVFGQVGVFNSIQVTAPSLFSAKVTQSSLEVQNNAQVDSLTVDTDGTVAGDFDITGDATANNIVLQNEVHTDVLRANNTFVVDANVTNLVVGTFSTGTIQATTINSVTENLTNLNASSLVATDDLTANTIDTVEISFDKAVATMRYALPSAVTSANGEMYFLKNGPIYYLAIKTPDGWKGAALSNIV